MAGHPFGDTAKVRGPPYLHPYVCVRCRSSFKRALGPEDHVAPCVRCKAPSIRVSRKFKPPRRDDLQQWKKVEALLRAGFVFQSLPERYPDTLAEVEGFAQRQAAHLIEMRRRYPELCEARDRALGKPA